ncbi:MAG: polysaccharide deacetylase family protein [Bacillales bacterium]|nr:polysaccharide deacetylase family protein [Bacillales bacterium]
MKKKVALLVSVIIVFGLVILSYKELKQFVQISSLKKKEPKAIVVKNLNVNQFLKTNKNNVPIYESLDGKLIVMATLTKGQEINSKDFYDHNWYEIRVGNNYGFISKKDVVLLTKPSQHLKDDLNRNSILKYYITTNNTPVYGHYTGPLVQIASLPKDERYPMSVYNKKWLTMDIAGKIGYVKRTSVKLDDGIPVLTYHHLLEKSENKLFRHSAGTITPESFNKQMSYLYQQHFTSITTGDLANYLNGKMILPRKTVLITFDDGIQSVYRYAYPVLKKYHLKATEFIITARISKISKPWNPNKESFLSYQEMNQMKDIFEYQSHTNNLHNINHNQSDVVTKPYNVVKADIALSQKILNADSFAYPFGQYNHRTIKILKELGFKSAFTTTEGYAKTGDNPFLIPRIIVTPAISLSLFKYLVN